MLTSQKKKSNGISMAELMGDIDAQFETFRRGFAPGEAVQCTVVSVGDENLVLDLNAKFEGFIPRADLDPDSPMPSTGDVLTLYFVSMQDGAARMTQRLSGAGAAVDKSILDAFQARLPLEGTVEKECNGGYEVTLCGQRAFCPYSQIDISRTREGAEAYIGRKFSFLVVEYDPEEHTLVVSRRALQEAERAARRDELRATLKEGDVREGVVTALMPFGAFVDIGGLEGLVPLKELSWDRTAKLEDILAVGQKVTVAILALNWDDNRFTLSLRAIETDPWTRFLESHGEGDELTVKVTKLMPFGAFAQLAPGVEGLIPISRLGNGRRLNHPREAVKEGDELFVSIESIDPESRRASLKPIDERVRALAPGELAVGATVRGIVESYRDFGVFVRLSESKTGLLHISECDIERGGNPASKLELKFPHGSEILVVVKALDGDRVSLSLPGSKKDDGGEEDEDIVDLLRRNNDAASKASFGSFGNLLSGLDL